MRFRAATGNLLRRLEALEARSMDDSRLVPQSPEWLTYWDRQALNHALGIGSPLFPVEALRAMMHYADDPTSMFGQLCREAEATNTALAPM